MDPLSVAASITAILQLTGTVLSYLNDIKNASKDRAQVAIEASGAYSLLTALRYRIEGARSEDPWFDSVKALAVKGGVLEQFRSALEQLESKLRPVDGVWHLKSALTWKFDKKETSEILSKIERLKSLASFALTNDLFTLSQATKDDVATLDKRVAGLQLSQCHRERQAIIKWLAPLDFSSQQQDLISKREHGTGQWFLSSETFKWWLDEKDQNTLFCPGIPGAGKSMVAAIVIDHLCENFEGQNVGIGYLYCNYKRQSEQTLIALFTSLLAQLIRGQTSIIDQASSPYEDYLQRNTRPKLEEIVSLIEHEARRYLKVFLIVDALDEFGQGDDARGLLISNLRLIQSKAPAKLMVTSRTIPRVAWEFEDDLQALIRADREDVMVYIGRRLSQLPACVVRSTILQDKIKQGVSHGVDGMFLLARLHLDSLRDKTTPKAIEARLRTLPKGPDALSSVYTEAMERINSQLPGFRELAYKTLFWITFAQRPLIASELLHALAVEMGEPCIHEDNFEDVEEIVSVCAGLVAVDETSKIIRLVHYTAQQYFEETYKSYFPNAQVHITRTCLTYLSFDAFSTDKYLTPAQMWKKVQVYEFFNYASENWGFHAIECPPDAILPQGLQFLTQVSKVSCATPRILWRPYEKIRGKNEIRELWGKYCEKCHITSCNHAFKFRKFSGLCLAAYFGLDEVIRHLLRSEAIAETGTTYREAALHVAAMYRKDSTVQLLLQSMVDLEAKDIKGKTALIRTAKDGHETTMRLLIEYGANVQAADRNGKTSLHQAAAYGHLAIARLLLEHGAKKDVLDHIGWTPLHRAARNRRETTMRLLIENGAIIDATDCNGEIPLLQAVTGRSVETVRLLLESGANIETSDRGGSTALLSAVRNGDLEMVQLLLESGAEIELEGDTPLIASCRYHMGEAEAITRLLIDRGAQVNASEPNSGRTALSFIAQTREGISWELPGRHAMFIAVPNASIDLMKRLVKAGAHVNAANKHGETALHHATRSASHRNMQALLELGADVNAEDTNGRTPLHVTAARGSINTLRLLLDHKADVEARTSNGASALDIAINRAENSSTHDAAFEIVKLLKEAMADMEQGT